MVLWSRRSIISAMPDVPGWYPDPEEEPKPAPGPLLLVQAFANTLDLEYDSDILADPDTATSWLTEAGLLSAGAAPTRDDLELARDVRASIRSLIESNREEAPRTPELAPLRKLADTHHPRLAVTDDGSLELENPRREDLGDGLFELLLIIRTAQQDGTWTRLKICANPECQWTFYDRSRNQHGNWCNMALCGNRLKNRQLRARRR
jgi:predicted RNA-binding Zn ribbon-like protein